MNAEAIVRESRTIKSAEHYAREWLAELSPAEKTDLAAGQEVIQRKLIMSVYADYRADEKYMALRNSAGYDPITDPFSNWSRVKDAAKIARRLAYIDSLKLP